MRDIEEGEVLLGDYGEDYWDFEGEKITAESKHLCIFARNLYHLLRGHKRHPVIIGN